MAEHPIQGLMDVTMDKIHQMVDSNTIIGKAITTPDGTTILPVSKVSFGFASGGTDFDGQERRQPGAVRRRFRRRSQHPAGGFWWSRMAACAPSSCPMRPTRWTGH